MSRVREALEKARQKGDRRDDDLMIIDHFLLSDKNHGTGNTIFIVDYKNLKEYSPKDVPATGHVCRSAESEANDYDVLFGCHQNMEGTKGAERVTLYRDENLYINGVRFPMRRLKEGEQQQLWLGNAALTDRDYETELEGP